MSTYEDTKHTGAYLQNGSGAEDFTEPAVLREG